jgi:hypothetical protein
MYLRKSAKVGKFPGVRNWICGPFLYVSVGFDSSPTNAKLDWLCSNLGTPK